MLSNYNNDNFDVGRYLEIAQYLSSLKYRHKRHPIFVTNLALKECYFQFIPQNDRALSFYDQRTRIKNIPRVFLESWGKKKSEAN